jgi:hypothetical protein
LVLVSCKKKKCEQTLPTPQNPQNEGVYGWMNINMDVYPSDSFLMVLPKVFQTPFGASNSNNTQINCGNLFFNNQIIPFSSNWYFQGYSSISSLPGYNSFRRNFENAGINFIHPDLGPISFSFNSTLPICATPTIPAAISLSSSYVVKLGVANGCNRIGLELSGPYLSYLRYAFREAPTNSNNVFTFMPSEISGIKAGDSCYVSYSLIQDSFSTIAGKPFWFTKSIRVSKKIAVLN